MTRNRDRVAKSDDVSASADEKLYTQIYRNMRVKDQYIWTPEFDVKNVLICTLGKLADRNMSDFVLPIIVSNLKAEVYNLRQLPPSYRKSAA